MTKLPLIIASLLVFCTVASALEIESKDGSVQIPGQYVEKGHTIDCQAEKGCVVMTPQELEAIINAIYELGRKELAAKKQKEI